MTWLFVVQGVCFKTSNTENMDSFKESSEYQSLKNTAKELGLVINDQYNDDYEESEYAIFFGKELHPDRHLYCGQTHCFPLSPFDTSSHNDALSELRELISQHFGNDVTESEGVIVSQFD